jgi:phosphohistidine phosphatase SixA
MSSTFKHGIAAMLLTCAALGGVAAALLTPLFHSNAEHSVPQAVLTANPYVILIRHGDAPGRNEPPAFDLSDCDTQRNLSDKGRHEARELGKAIKARDINVTKILASRWCRTQETAQLLNLAPVESSSAFDNLEMNRSRATALIDRERELIVSWRGPGVMLVVTHSSNIKLLTGMNIEQGSMIVAPPMDDTSSTPRFGKIVLKSSAS